MIGSMLLNAMIAMPVAALGLMAQTPNPARNLESTKALRPVADTPVEISLIGRPGGAPANARIVLAPNRRGTLPFPCYGTDVPLKSPGPYAPAPDPWCTLTFDADLGLLSVSVPRSIAGNVNAQLNEAAAELENCKEVPKGKGRKLGCHVRMRLSSSQRLPISQIS